MSTIRAAEPGASLRLWPGVAIVLIQWAARFGLPVLGPDLVIYAVAAGFAGALALVAWWLFFSRAPWPDRIGAIVVMIAAMAATWPFLDVSMATGAMGVIFPMLARLGEPFEHRPVERARLFGPALQHRAPGIQEQLDRRDRR